MSPPYAWKLAVLKFDAREVRALVLHCQKHPIMSVMIEHMADEQCWKPGALADEFGWARREDVDQLKIKPYIILVKDRGVYLMAGSEVRLPGKGDSHKVVYAAGYGADADYDAVYDVAGGDDFGYPLPLSWFLAALDDTVKTIRISLTERSVRLLVPTRRKL